MKHRNYLVIAIILLGLCPMIASAEVWSELTPLTSINSDRRDTSAFLTADGKTMYLSSDRGGDFNLLRMDMYVSHLIGDVWSTPELIPGPVNLPNVWDDQPSLTLDGHYMYFYRALSPGLGDIYMSENINGVWQEPAPLTAVNSDYDDGEPTISPDGLTLMFASDRPGGYGAADLYYSQKVNGVWQPAVNMGSTINTPDWETAPEPSYSGRWLFFSYAKYSKLWSAPRHAPTDIYRAENVDGVWQTPVKLPASVNTRADDVVSYFLDCTNTIYIGHENGPGGINWDQYTSTWLDAPGPNVCSSLVIPKGRWRVRVTLLKASEFMMNDDVFIDVPTLQPLIRNALKNVGTVVTTPFLSADELVFSVRVRGDASGQHDIITSNSEFARVDRTDPLRYIVGFEDPLTPPDQRDFEDLKLLVELVGEEVNIWENQNYLGETQVIELWAPPTTMAAAQFVQPSSLTEGLNLGIPLTKGLSLDAAVSIPAAGLVESTYAIITEGDPVLYAELIDKAPFFSTGDFLKVELLNGQVALASHKQADISISYLDGDDDGFLDGTAILEQELQIWKLDLETTKWEPLPSKVNGRDNIITAKADSFSLFALGGKFHDQLWGGSADHQANSGLFGCALAAGPVPATNFYGMLLLAAGPVALWRVTRSRRRRG